MSSSSNDTLHIGLCLAGAVSAGAYTAGVIDYLIEALEAWEEHRQRGEGPTHRVVIPAIGGASAGGMTGIIASSLVNNPLSHVREASTDVLEAHPENKLYHSWVDMLDRDMFPLMLKTDDMEGSIFSLLNSDFIDTIAERALAVDHAKRIERPYFSKDLKLFATLTNLKGYTYHTQMAGGHQDSAYYFSRHNDYAAFTLGADGPAKGWIPLDYFTGKNVSVAKDAAMATGAFPAGLRARRLQRPGSVLNKLTWNRNITTKWPLPDGPDDTLCVDGGVINNEPFYRVKELLEAVAQLKSAGANPTVAAVEEQAGSSQSTTIDTFTSTTIMIDPFPSVRPDPFDNDDSLFSVAGKTFSAMLSQVRLKPESLEEIYDPADPSLYLIAPIRYHQATGQEHKVQGAKALACGFLGGFGGFIHKEFRVHDFFLGRANCEQFLREYFTVPKDTTNPIFKNGYEGVNTSPFLDRSGERLQIIPVFTKKRTTPYMPVFSSGTVWPQLPSSALKRFSTPLKKRAGKLIMNIARLNKFNQLLLWIGNRVILRRKLAAAAMKAIQGEMRRWNLLS